MRVCAGDALQERGEVVFLVVERGFGSWDGGVVGLGDGEVADWRELDLEDGLERGRKVPSGMWITVQLLVIAKAIAWRRYTVLPEPFAPTMTRFETFE